MCVLLLLPVAFFFNVHLFLCYYYYYSVHCQNIGNAIHTSIQFSSTIKFITRIFFSFLIMIATCYFILSFVFFSSFSAVCSLSLVLSVFFKCVLCVLYHYIYRQFSYVCVCCVFVRVIFFGCAWFFIVIGLVGCYSIAVLVRFKRMDVVPLNCCLHLLCVYYVIYIYLTVCIWYSIQMAMNRRRRQKEWQRRRRKKQHTYLNAFYRHHTACNEINVWNCYQLSLSHAPSTTTAPAFQCFLAQNDRILLWFPDSVRIHTHVCVCLYAY